MNTEEIEKIKQQILAIVLKNEDKLIAVENRISLCVEESIAAFNKKTKELEEKGSTLEAFESIKKEVHHDLQKKMDALLIELTEESLKTG